MATRKSKWLGILAIVSSLLISSVASAQQVDWPTLKGTNTRVGYNGDAGPGAANLRWWTPNSITNQFTTNLLVDNTDNAAYGYAANTNGTFTVGSVSGGVYTTMAPPQVGTASNYPWHQDPLCKQSTNYDAAPAWLEYDTNNNYNEREPAYVYAKCVAASSRQDPTAGATLAAQWNFTPANGIPNLFALYVWIPLGPQVDPAVGPANTSPPGEMFAQEFYVYKIATQGRTIVDVVDTAIAGGGWVRLGSGGAATNMVFPYDGINPLTVTLLNTIPRDSSGVLTAAVGSVVYADAAQAVPTTGFYDASPVSAQLTAGNQASTRTVAALNQFSSGGIGNAFTTIATGQVTSYAFDTGTPIWTYSPVQSDTYPIMVDVAPANSTNGFTADAIPPHAGPNQAETTKILAADGSYTQTVTYAPNLNTGTYQIFAYVPGSNTTETYGQKVQVLVYEGGVNPSDVVYVNQNAVGGWVQVGTRRYVNVASSPTQTAAPLSVKITNGSSNAGDIGSYAYADAIRFIGERNQTISSTPVIANVNINWVKNQNIVAVPTQVVIVADENGVLHCLDSAGNADGTTKEYWSYPSVLDSGGNDPNQTAQYDLGAEMPTGFNLSSALVQKVGTSYYLYVGTTNGRIYCIDMAGRGDGANENDGSLPTTRTIGTTTRVWTYPSTAPSGKQVPSSNLGTFRGSIAFGDPNGATPTIYVPTTQGRVYALDAVGNADLSTNVRWQYPAANSPTLGEIWTTPTFSVIGGVPYLYFGTRVNTNDDSNGAFYCLNVSTALTARNPVWVYAGGNVFDAVSQTTISVNTGDFLSSPAVVPQNLVNAAYPSTDAFVYVANQNNYTYALDALTGVPQFATNELNVGTLGATSFTQMITYNNAGGLSQFPVVLVPTLDGRFDALFADPAKPNQFGTYRAYEYVTASSAVVASLAVSNNWMYGADQSGFLYAFNNGTGTITGGTPPGGQTIVENNPAGAIFRHAKIMLVTQQGYNKLRQPTGQNLDYYTATSTTNNPYAFNRNPLAFEWGESAYVMVYNFPFITSNGSGTVAPPIVNISFSSQGTTITRPAIARLFTEPPNAPDDPSDPNFPNGTERDNAYAILQFPLGTGQTQLPPGNGTISISIQTSALNTFGASQTVALNPRESNVPYYLANPLAVSMPDANGNPGYDPISIGLSTTPSNPENLVNGSPLISNPNTAGKLTNLLGTSAGMAHHGSSITTRVFVYDKSMTAANNGGVSGLSKVHLDVRNLAWQGGAAAIYKPLNTTIYSNFEDLPGNYPNNSIDYPDIQSQQVQAVSNPNGSAQSPTFGGSGVTLNPPMVKDPNSGTIRPMTLGDQPEWRILQPTPFNLTINVPRFQPANSNGQLPLGTAMTDSQKVTLPYQGYEGRLRVFVPNLNNTTLQTVPSTANDAYRGFNLFTSVDVDEKLTISTPSVTLGTLGEGTGYNPFAPGAPQGYNAANPSANGPTIFQPWGGNLQSLFQPLVINNEGNVNFLNLRLAKQNALSGLQPWGIFASGNDNLGFLDAYTDVWSDFDAVFSPPSKIIPTFNQVALQKPRVIDATPTQLTSNMIRRANPNLGISVPGVYNNSFPARAPRVSVSVPLGMPVGSYSQVMRVIEKTANNEAWQYYNNSPETYSDPTFTLNFNVRESQLTTSFTPNTSSMADTTLATPTPANPYAFSNVQPAMVRDPFGSLIVGWSSDRPNWNPGNPLSTSVLGNYKLYLATVGNTASYGSFGITNTADPTSPLSDLNNFKPASSAQWFNQAVGPYPSQAPDVLFGSLAGESVIASTVQFGNPSFPQSGLTNPYNTAQTLTGMYMAFTGNAQKQTPSGRLGESYLFMTLIQPAANGNIGTPPQPIAMGNDPLITKGKPSVLQTMAGAMVFYPGTAGGQSTGYYSYFNGSTFGPSVALPFGSAFQSVSSLSASGRVYSGAGSVKSDGVTPLLRSGDDIVDLTFAGQMQGRANSEVFMGRLKLNPATMGVVDENGAAIDSAASDGNAFINFAQRYQDLLTLGNQPGLYRATGVMWDSTSLIDVVQLLNGTVTSVVIPGTQTYDRVTGIITCDSRLGGKIYIDTTLGTVRFASGFPNQSAQIGATYTPRFLRISAGGGAGYGKATGLFDHREISNTNPWRFGNSNGVGPNADVRTDRYVYTYNRAAGGAGLPARPYMASMRLGVQLRYRIAVDNTGTPLFLKVTGVLNPVTGVTKPVTVYQFDPANGRIYFSGLDEDNTVTVQYSALKEDGTSFNATDSVLTVALIPEVAEQQILIDNAVNEGDLTSFLDPFTYVSGAARRPPLTWLFWSSSRRGNSDIYFETISPNWVPFPISQ